MNNPIVKRIYLRASVQLRSPLSVSNGDEINSRSDIIRDYTGAPFIPATSVAGAMRQYLSEDNETANKLFGYIEKNTELNIFDNPTGRMSPLVISDVFFDIPERTVISVRDGVRLNPETKTAIARHKYDYEIIETGVKATLKIELVIRQKSINDEETFIESIRKIFSGINSGEIRFGAKKTRGLGKMRVTKVEEKIFTCDNMDEWIDFDIASSDMDDGEYWICGNIIHSRYISLKIPLKLHGGISVRKYSAKPDAPDYSHITLKNIKNGRNIPVIPGSSFNGAIRSRAFEILKLLGFTHADNMIKRVFGFVDEEDRDRNRNHKVKSAISKIVISECILKNSTPLPSTRTKINRFDGGTIDGGLYTELSYFGGETDLEILVKKDDDTEWLIGLLLLVMKDIHNGYLSIGGETSIGRGLFEANGDIEISTKISEAEYISKLRCEKERDKIS